MPTSRSDLLTSTSSALFALSERYLQAWQDRYQHLPICNDELASLASPCLIDNVKSEGEQNHYWQPIHIEPSTSLSKVERGIEILLHADIHAFYGSQYSADMEVKWGDSYLTLLQVWSEEDFDRLQENIIGHLVTQQRLKLKPTVFIATTENEWDVISICNLTGNVILERIGSKKRELLAENLTSFLSKLMIEV